MFHRCIVRRIAAALLGCCLAVVTAEGALRALRPLDMGQGIEVVDATHPVAHFTPHNRSLARSSPSAPPVEIAINNAGYRNDQDYERGLTTPLLALIGDSYVAAAMVPYDQTLSARLARRAAESVLLSGLSIPR